MIVKNSGWQIVSSQDWMLSLWWRIAWGKTLTTSACLGVGAFFPPGWEEDFFSSSLVCLYWGRYCLDPYFDLQFVIQLEDRRKDIFGSEILIGNYFTVAACCNTSGKINDKRWRIWSHLPICKMPKPQYVFYSTLCTWHLYQDITTCLKKGHICKTKKNMTRPPYFFHFHTYWAGAHLPRVPRPIFRKFKTLSNMERMIKKYGRSELKRIGTQEPKNGTEQPKQNEKIYGKNGEVRLVWSILLVFPNNMSQDLIQSRIKTQFVFISSWLRSIPQGLDVNFTIKRNVSPPYFYLMIISINFYEGSPN